MSNFLAVATVTETFRKILQDAIKESKISIANALATALRPTTGTNGLPTVGVNLYLYQVTPNGALRNADQPSRRGDGTILEAPQIALDLDYLLTFYGAEQKLEPQRVMGGVLSHLNSYPLLTREKIQEAKGEIPDNSGIVTSDLDDQIELVRLRMMPMTLEELSKLWSVLFQTAHVLSVVYQASVVLIQGDEVAQPALPVRRRKLYVETIRQPRIEAVLSQKGSGEPQADQPIVLGDTLILVGRGLQGDTTRVRVGKTEVEPAEIGQTRIRVPLGPPTFPADSLRAGVQGVQVVHWRAMGEPAVPHAGVDSNVVPFVLRPTIVGDVEFSANQIKLTVSPAVGSEQRVVLLLNELNPPVDHPARAYRFDVVPADPLTVQVKDVAAGEYLIRIQVDGAESLLELGDYPYYSKPTVLIT